MKTNDEQSEDFFARVAAQRQSARGRDLVQPGPPKLVPRPFPHARSPSPFVLPKTMATAEALQAELARQRGAHARFLRDCAPPLAPARARRALDSFDWRVETPEDAADFGRVLRGEGTWTRVAIPHYGAPIGRAFTFYRTAFELPPEMFAPGRLFLRCEGVDYTAELFLNGTPVGSHEGFFAPFEADVTRAARPGANVLTVRVGNDYIFMGNGEPRREGDKLYAATGPGFDDPVEGWHHCPPGMGIYQGVALEARPPLFISDIFVRPLLPESRAEAWVEITSCGPDPREIALDLSLFGANFPVTVFRARRFRPTVLPVQGSGDVPGKEAPSLAPLRMGPGANLLRIPFPVPSPRTWSPPSPWLYQLQVRLRDETGATIDAAARRFGMRSFALQEDSTPRGKLLLNGSEIRLRGANTMGFEQQAVMAGDRERLVDDILLAKICRMNFLRLTQRPVQDQVYDLCDRLGLMTQTDLPLFAVMRRTKFAEGVRQAGEMERLVRAHPCNVLVSFINEALPNGMNEPHRHLTRPELDAWTAAAGSAVLLENPDRVIKPHDGDYDPPGPGLPDNHCYCGWYNGHGVGIGRLHRGWWQPVKPGWHLACGEFGSEGLDPVELMRRRYPADWLPQTAEEEKRWNPDAIPSAQTGRFHFMWFDTPGSLAGWVEASHAHQAWVTKLMTEAFRRNAAMNSFAIHLFIDAFPSGWMKTIMDTDRKPKPAFFAYRDALAPTMVSLRTDRFAVRAGETVEIETWIACDLDEPRRGLQLAWQATDGPSLLCGGRTRVNAPRCSSSYAGTISFPAPAVVERARVAVQAALRDERGRVIHANEVVLDVFPRAGAPTASAPRKALILGRRDGPAAVLARGLGIACSFGGDPAAAGLVIVDDMDAYTRAAAPVSRAVRGGAVALFVELPTGTHRIAGSSLTVRATGMGAFFFASRATGHGLVAGFRPRDFFLWYDPEEDCIMPLLSTTMDAPPGWETVVSTGHVSWTSASRPAQACVQKTLGSGVFRVCQLALAGRLVNPAAEELARRLTARP